MRTALVALLTALILPVAAQGATVQLYDVPTNDANLRALALGGDGALWFTERKGLKVGRIDTSGAIKEYPITTHTDIGDNGPDDLVASTDGKIWFYSDVGSTVWRIDPSTSPPTLANAYNEQQATDGLSAAAGGGVWSTFLGGDGYDADDDALMRIDSNGAQHFFAASYAESHPLALSPDGTAWFADGLGSSTLLKHVDDPNSGHISNTPFSSPSTYEVTSIAFAPGDPNPYFTEYQPPSWPISAHGGAIGHMVGGQAQVTPLAGDKLPASMVAGPDGALWWSEDHGLGRLDPRTGAIQETSLGNYAPGAIAFGSDGALWFLDNAANKIGRIAIDGTLFAAPPAVAPPVPATPAPAPTTPKTPAKPMAPTFTLRTPLLKATATHLPVRCTIKSAGTCAVTLKLKTKTLGRASHTFKKAGASTLSIKFGATARSALRHAKGKTTVTLTATSSGKGLTNRVSTKHLSLRR